MTWQTSLAVESYRAAGEDRAAVFPTPFGCLAVVADGVGGRSGGAAAADAVIEAVRSLAEAIASPLDLRSWATWLRQLDQQMAGEATVGETTAVIAALSAAGIIGVAVGDSVAWVAIENQCHSLATGSEPKPWLGSGVARPVPFAHLNLAGTLLLATDGLTKYADRQRIVGLLQSETLERLPKQLIDAVRYGSGRLPDDVGVIVAKWEA
ncbi:SpoIIE family protein phosphatase [Limnoglobus roseus]|uniref:Serine/threonine protein phosphatase n=1 Tax=Limnoglobus roseus TaxID=2598579 RepID=A0A5C1A5W3_9BACT|nr:SpoIIE family protein phosphatase [Limnoglobus roseus]QEL14569.1 serine/threonine protein phosphatase [Limnoglobus roseus]